MRSARSLIVLVCLALSGCCCLRDGVVVKKLARSEMPEAYDLYSLAYRYEPSVYWVEIQGKDDKGATCTKNIILFRHDWDALRVGDHWSKQSGFSPAEAGK